MRFLQSFAQGKSYMIFLFLIFLSLLASRRWQQLIFQVWGEDGKFNILQFINNVWLAFLDPVQDYLITVPKIIFGISLSISFFYYLLISWPFIALVGLTISFAPTRLRFKVLCAMAVFVIPSAHEVFGLPLYIFWWASLLLLLVVLWDERNPSVGWRVAFSLLGSGMINYIKTNKIQRNDVNAFLKNRPCLILVMRHLPYISGPNGDYAVSLAKAYKGKFERCSQFNIPVRIGVVK